MVDVGVTRILVFEVHEADHKTFGTSSQNREAWLICSL